MARSLLTTLSLIALTSSLFAVGCAGADDAAQGDDDSQAEADLTSAVTITEADFDARGTYGVTTGERVVIKVNGNPTTGYEWKVKDDGGPLCQGSCRLRRVAA